MFKTNNKFSGIRDNLVLYFLIVMFIVFSSIPVKFFSWIETFPNIALIIIFYFMIVKSESTNYIALFFFGILFDIFNNCLLGTTALTLLISGKLINFLRSHLYTADNFITIFRDFIIFAFLYSGIQWIIFSMVNKYSYSFLSSLWQFFVNVIFFAILYKLLKKFENRL